MTNKKFLIAMAVVSFLFANSANAAILPSGDIIAPDSPFYFLQTWKESIQTFFTFGAENKAKQYLHLAEVRLAEYQKMVEKGKTEIAQKILDKYEKQLNNALGKTEELKNKGKDVKDLSQKIEETVAKHLEVLQENLQKVPEQAKKGLENAIENSQKKVENILGKKLKKDETAGWKTYRNEKYGFELKIPSQWNQYKIREKIMPPDYGPTYYFALPTKEEGWSGYDELFAISILTKAQWEKYGAEFGGFEIGRNEQYVAVASYSQVKPAGDLEDVAYLRGDILSTFKFLK